MKLYKYLFLSIICLPMYCFSNPGSWTPSYQKIANILVEGGNTGSSALIVIEGGVPSTHIPSACNSGYNTADLTTEHGRSIYTLALAAYMSGKPVKMALACAGSRPFITHLKI